MSDDFLLGGKNLSSRLLMGSASFADASVMTQALKAGDAAMVTVAMRRLPLDGEKYSFLNLLKGHALLPNTSSCETVADAILTAQLAREALDTNWIKLEVIADRESLLPDPEGLLEAAARLIEDGFIVLPYCSDDPILCRHLERMGCAAVMPLASPIGTGLGIRNPHSLSMIRKICSCPVIVDAGIGSPSDACLAMELGCDAVLVNSAVARAQEPVVMAGAMKNAVKAGRQAYLAGMMPKSQQPRATSSWDNIIGQQGS